jgi:hypothetical protein
VHDHSLATRGRQRGTRQRQRFDQLHVARHRVGARRPDFADDVDFLASVLLDRHRDLSVLEKALGGELLFQ